MIRKDLKTILSRMHEGDFWKGKLTDPNFHDDILENGTSNTLSGIDADNDGLDNAFEGSNVNDMDVNDEIDNPLTGLPDEDSDANVAYVDQGNGADDFNT